MMNNKLLLLGIVALAMANACTATLVAEEPEIVVGDDGEPRLVLPTQLSEYIDTHLPGVYVPGPQEYQGRWEELATADSLPYAVWGDVDGNGLTDVALILLLGDGWRPVAFRQVAEGTYEHEELGLYSGYPARDVHDFSLELLEAGTALAIDGRSISSLTKTTDVFVLWDFYLPEMDLTPDAFLYAWFPATSSFGATVVRSGGRIGE